MISWIARLLFGLIAIPVMAVFLLACLVIDALYQRRQEREVLR